MSKKLYNNKHNTKSNTNKKVYKTKNWSEYNKSLINRGNITFWISESAIKKWLYSGIRKQGAPIIYSNLAIETILIIRFLFCLPLRNTQGLVISIIKLMNLNLVVPDYTTISRRQKSIKKGCHLKRYKKNEPIDIIIDSTGLKVFGEGEWKVRRHGYSKRRMWRKLHIVIDQKGNIITQKLTTNSISDSSAAETILDNIKLNVSSVSGDAGYDRKKIYKICKKLNSKAIIRPQNNARIRTEDVFLDRNKNVSDIRSLGSKKWRIRSGYSKRALVETAIFRYKITFGDKPQAHKFENQITEVAIKCYILNKFYELGRPNSYLTIA